MRRPTTFTIPPADPFGAKPAPQVRFQQVTPELAATWLETMPYELQRNVSQPWVDFLAEEIKRGSFKQNTTIHIAVLDGRSHLIDGQHRLWAVVQSGVAQPFIVYESPAQTNDQIAWMYATTDIGRKRRAGEVTKGLRLSDEVGLSQLHIDAMSATIAFMRNALMRGNKEGGRCHPDDLVAGIRLYAPYAVQLFELAAGDGPIRRACRRAATLSIALLTLRYVHTPGVAYKFWRGVVKDDGLTAGDPRKYANRHLLTVSMVNGLRSGSATMTPARSARILATCFNAYVAGREMAQTPRVPDETAPIRIAGVPTDPAKWME